jgi:RNA polymerase sigma-70 factor (ECF subfamily)
VGVLLDTPRPAVDLSDEELVARAQRELPHRTEAVGIIMQRHRAMVLSRARRILPSLVDAEDAAQDVWHKVLIALPGYRPERPFTHWLQVIVRNVCLARLARRRRRGVSLAAHAHELHSESPIARDPILRGLLHELLDALSPRTREAVELRFLGGLTHREIALALGLKESAVKMRIFRACSAMRAAYECKTTASAVPMSSSSIGDG